MAFRGVKERLGLTEGQAPQQQQAFLLDGHDCTVKYINEYTLNWYGDK